MAQILMQFFICKIAHLASHAKKSWTRCSDIHVSSMSVYKMKSRGPRREPRGTPASSFPYPLVHGWHLVLLCVTWGGVPRRHPADGHLSVTFALRTLHPHKLHVVVLVEAKRHPLGHLSSNTHLQNNTPSGPSTCSNKDVNIALYLYWTVVI